MDKEKVLNFIKINSLISVVRGQKPKKIIKIVDALIDGGVNLIEITMDSKYPLNMLNEVNSHIDNEIAIGAGTVLDAETARSAIFAGADFIVSPILNTEVIEMSKRYNKVVIPGVMTPSEMIKAWEKGADFVKVFPAKTLGPDFIKSVKGPLGQVEIIPTGGINLNNIDEYIKAGSAAVGVGSSLINKEAIKKGLYEQITEKAELYIEKINNSKN
ncbi:MAG: bifunctional 4-hydroxy-2-oxoglutarate aldolase/2-dehydro-3-deoxy-phosphogluconate aldolase [Bacillota bacterium]